MWAGLILQYLLMLEGGAAGGPGATTVRFFSYFTVLTNLLVAIAQTASALAPASRLGRFVDRPDVRTALLTYILIVGVIYWLLLAHIWDPQGAQLVADTILHTLVPAAFLADWLLSVDKRALRWSDPLRWLAYPAIYAGWTLLHGAASGFYPYWFIDAGALGYPATFINAALVCAAFLGVGLLAVAAARLIARRHPLTP